MQLCYNTCTHTPALEATCKILQSLGDIAERVQNENVTTKLKNKSNTSDFAKEKKQGPDKMSLEDPFFVVKE